MEDLAAIIAMVFVVLAVWGVQTYNRFVKLRHLIEEGWSAIDIALKRRVNLIPNLVVIARQYARHEAGVLESVTAQRLPERSHSQDASTSERDIISAFESKVSQSLGGVLAVAEAYPDLKANEAYIELSQSLNQVELEIVMARKAYNVNVRQLNTALGQFPSGIIGRLFNFKKRSYFSLALATQRDMPDFFE